MKEYKRSSHHIIPTSRRKFGREVILPKKFHSALHTVWGNLYGREIELFIKELNQLMEEKDEITNTDLNKLRQEIRGMNLYEFRKSKEDKAGKVRKV